MCVTEAKNRQKYWWSFCQFCRLKKPCPFFFFLLAVLNVHYIHSFTWVIFDIKVINDIKLPIIMAQCKHQQSVSKKSFIIHECWSSLATHSFDDDTITNCPLSWQPFPSTAITAKTHCPLSEHSIFLSVIYG